MRREAEGGGTSNTTDMAGAVCGRRSGRSGGRSSQDTHLGDLLRTPIPGIFSGSSQDTHLWSLQTSCPCGHSSPSDHRPQGISTRFSLGHRLTLGRGDWPHVGASLSLVFRRGTRIPALMGIDHNGPMTRPRSELVDRENGGFYHLFNRCVRQAWLCGEDPYTGENFDHRRGWIEQRLLTLTEVFPVDVYAYAVMSNHYHMVVNYCPARVQAWSDTEIARRWLCVFGPRPRNPQERAGQEAALLADQKRLTEIRQHLGDLSWYMRCLNEHIARRANKEDDRTGRFWDGRFDSRPLPDAEAAHACMVYNDLNPLRAGMVAQIDAPQQTSLRRRLEEAETAPKRMQEPLRPLRLEHGSGRVLSAGESALATTLEEYLSQAEWTAARCRGEGVGTDPPLCWRSRRTWLTTFAAQRRRTQRRRETPAWLAAIV